MYAKHVLSWYVCLARLSRSPGGHANRMGVGFKFHDSSCFRCGEVDDVITSML